MKLPKNVSINKHAIELEIDKQLPYRSIYALNLIESETLNTYIKTHFKTGLIQLFKSPAGAPILFDKKPDRCF